MIKNSFKGKPSDNQKGNGSFDEVADNVAGSRVEQGGDNVSENTSEDSDTTAGMSGEESVDWKDRYLRLSAEFDNYRKRTLREKMDLVLSGGEDVIKSLLPVLDDMDRAMEAMNSTADIDSVRTGIGLIHNKLVDSLAQKGLSEVEAVGEPMDADMYEAVAKVAAEPECKGRIVDVVQKGYKLKDKVIRYAKVVVGE